MAEESNGKKPGSEKLTVSNRPKLSLTQTVESGQVQQVLRGHSKTVTVEVRRTRTFSSADEKNKAKGLDDKSGLTKSEQEARLSALENAAKTKAEEALKPKPSSSEKSAKDKPGGTTFRDKAQDVPPPVNDLEGKKSRLVLTGDTRKSGLEREETYTKNTKAVKGEGKRRQGKITVAQALDQNERHRSLAAIKRQRNKAAKKLVEEEVPAEQAVREVRIPEVIEVQELANRMAIRSVDVIKSLMKLGVMIKTHDTIDADTAEIIVTEFGHKPKRVTEADVEKAIVDSDDVEENLEWRPPIVTVMGHVDHGKTSLLDAIRATDVVSGEAGGITQHIGAYQITLKNGQKITFLDTPGHEAFTAMRARGAKVTDIVVLVVAADDGIMPQTIEAINHAKAAEVPIIVAINKIDKPGANPEKVKQSLLTHELVPEDLGGEVMVVEVSAKQGTNLTKLEETILLQAEVLELKSNPNRKAQGTVVEAKLDKGRGVVTTLLVQRGTLKVGDIVIAGRGYGKVRALTNDKGDTVDSAPPSLPVEVLGLSETPNAGDTFAVVETDKQARDIASYRHKRTRDLQAAEQNKVTMEALFKRAKTGLGAVKELPIIVKSDVHGSAEAIIASLEKLSTDEVKVKVVHSGVGGITESDITLAQTVGAMVIGFNVRASSTAKALATHESIEMRYYSIIYNVVDDIKDLLSGLLEPTIHEKFLGNAEVLEVFKVSKVGKVAGCIVREGTVKRGAKVRLIRDNVVIHEGTLKTLKRFKDDASEVKLGMECGMAFENYDDMKKGDIIEAFEVTKEERKLK